MQPGRRQGRLPEVSSEGRRDMQITEVSSEGLKRKLKVKIGRAHV